MKFLKFYCLIIGLLMSNYSGAEIQPNDFSTNKNQQINLKKTKRQKRTKRFRQWRKSIKKTFKTKRDINYKRWMWIGVIVFLIGAIMTVAWLQILTMVVGALIFLFAFLGRISQMPLWQIIVWLSGLIIISSVAASSFLIFIIWLGIGVALTFTGFIMGLLKNIG